MAKQPQLTLLGKGSQLPFTLQRANFQYSVQGYLPKQRKKFPCPCCALNSYKHFLKQFASAEIEDMVVLMQPKCKATPRTQNKFLLPTISSAARLRCCQGRMAVPASAMLGAQQLHVSGQPGLKNMARCVPSCSHSSELLGNGSGSCSVPPFLDHDVWRGSSEL